MSAQAFGVYIHFPLCRRRCGYCDFAILPQDKLKVAFDSGAYFRKVLEEVEFRMANYEQQRLATIYLGGGTPSLWGAQYVARLISRLAGDAAPELEVTLEANPEDLTREGCRALHDAGVRRLSLGVQSTDDRWLARLSRVHSVAAARSAYDAARAAGFDNISCDLMYGFADQTVEDLLVQLDKLLSWQPEHISTYCLSLSPHAALRRLGMDEAAHDLAADMMTAARQRLEQRGYEQYEVSNFARPGFASRHNALVWHGNAYLGVGAAAHSLVFQNAPRTTGIPATRVRVANPPFSRYMASRPECDPVRHVSGARIDRLAPQAHLEELLLLGLRTRRGVDTQQIEQATGVDLPALAPEQLQQLVAEGWLTCDQNAIKPTDRGIYFADALSLALTSSYSGGIEVRSSLEA